MARGVAWRLATQRLTRLGVTWMPPGHARSLGALTSAAARPVRCLEVPSFSLPLPCRDGVG
jgi:hypothetical protein